MFSVLHELLFAPFAEFGFMRRALAGVVAIALGSTPVGVFLMLRRMSLTGDAMSHAILPGAAVGFLIAGLSLPAMTIGGIVAGMIVAVAAGFVSRVTVLREDASLAAFYLISLALGVLIVSLRGSSIDLMHVLFGSVLALNNEAILLLGSITTITLVVMALLYRALVLECVDPVYMSSVSRMSGVAHYSFLSLAVLNLVGGFHALGTLMAVGIMILPAAAARFWARRLETMLAAAVLIALVSGYAGLLLSYHLSLPSGPAIILAAGVAYLGSMLAGPVTSLRVRYFPPRHLEA